MEEIPSPPKIVRILTASRSPVNLKHLLKAPHREILWAVDLKNAARLINENEFDILLVNPDVIENWPERMALANYVHFIEYAKEQQPGLKVVLEGMMEEEIKESKDCRHYPRADGSWIYQEKGKPHPDYVVNVYQKLPSGIVSCSYNRLVKVLEGIEGQL